MRKNKFSFAAKFIAIISTTLLIALLLTGCDSNEITNETKNEDAPQITQKTSTPVQSPTNTNAPEPTPTSIPAETEWSEHQNTENLEVIELGSLVEPSSIAPTIDGTISPGEWDDSLVEYFADGSELLILYIDDYIYLGIRANQPEVIAANVFIENGDQISIMHSSAALGTAVYQKGDDNWLQVRDFSWCCRDTDNSESSQAERSEFLQIEEWLAANGLMGIPNELEYQIKIPDQSFLLAVVIIRTSYPYEKVPWPTNITDDCIKSTPSGLPEEFSFSLEQWVRVIFPQSAE